MKIIHYNNWLQGKEKEWHGSRSARKAAEEVGEYTDGDTVIITTDKGRVISKAIYYLETGKYILAEV